MQPCGTPHALGANVFVVDGEQRGLVAERHGDVDQSGEEFLEAGGLAHAAHALIQLFGQGAAALANSAGRGGPRGGAYGCSNPGGDFGFNLVFEVCNEAREILFANFPPVSGRRGGGHLVFSVAILTELTAIEAWLST
jgi:hypothetical protein